MFWTIPGLSSLSYLFNRRSVWTIVSLVRSAGSLAHGPLPSWREKPVQRMQFSLKAPARGRPPHACGAWVRWRPNADLLISISQRPTQGRH